MTEELKPIDVSKYTVTENGNVLKQPDNRTELEKEAIAKHKTGSYLQLHPDYRAFVHGYLAGAEPREKRIEELEEENKDIKALRKYEGSVASAEIKKIQEENTELNNKLKRRTRGNKLLMSAVEKLTESKLELEKENAELKAQIEKMKCCGNCKHFNFNEPNYCHKGVYRERQYVCSEWEFGN